MKIFFNRVLKVFITWGLKAYFSDWKITGVENIPKNQAVIFAANHQNAFLDALVIVCSTQQLPYYLARAGVFSGAWATKALTYLRIMPIYRFRDGLANVRKNDAIIETCNNILKEKESLVMFPEGNHGEKWNLRLLQKGLSRIAFKTQELNEWKEELYIVPVGIQYEEAASFKSRVLIQFGPAIKMSPYKQEWEDDPRQALNTLKEDIAEEIRPLILDIPIENYDKLIHNFHDKRVFKRDLEEQFKSDQKLIQTLSKESEVYSEESEAKPLKIISALFSIPAFILNFLPYQIINWYLKKNIKDPVFKGSLKFAFGIFLPPLFYILYSILIGFMTNNLLVGLLSFPACIIISLLGTSFLKRFYTRRGGGTQ